MRRRQLLKATAALTLGATARSMPAMAQGQTADVLRGTGDLGIVIERASGSILIVETSSRTMLGRITGLGDLSHATAVFSRDARYAFVFGRDGGLSKVDLLERRIARRVIQSGNAIGGAISDDGQIIAVANYEPGGVKLFSSATLDQVGDIVASWGGDKTSKVVGIADAPGRRFVFALYDADEIWIADCTRPEAAQVQKLAGVGKQPYDGLITGDGRHYLAGLFGEDGLVHVDLWQPELKAERILAGYGRGEEPLPVFKMPHMRGWAQAGDRFLLPAIGRHEALVVDARSFSEIGRVPLHGQPVFIMARPDGRHAWVNFAHPRNDTVQVIDTQSLKVIHELRPGPAVLHMEFTPRGDAVWISVRDADRIDIHDTRTYAKVAEIAAAKPSGILFASRAHRIGM